MPFDLNAGIFVYIALGGVAFWLLTVSFSRRTAVVGRVVAWLATLVVLWQAIQGTGQLVELIGIATLAAFTVYIIGWLLGVADIKDAGRGWFIPLFLILTVRTVGWEPYRIPSGSMLPTLSPGDYILVNRHLYGLNLPFYDDIIALPNSESPKRGDIIVFQQPETGTTLVKRLIGLPGDQIEMRDGYLWLNNSRLQVEPRPQSQSQDSILLYEYLSDGEFHRIQHLKDLRPQYGTRGWEVPEGHFFVLGDNRDNSRDSRRWGMVPANHLLGKVSLVWLRWEEGETLPSFGSPSEWL